MKDFKRVEELDDGLLEPEEDRGFTRGNSRRMERGGLRDQNFVQRMDDESGEDDEEGEE